MKSREISAEMAAGNPTSKAMFCSLWRRLPMMIQDYVKTRYLSVKHFIFSKATL